MPIASAFRSVLHFFGIATIALVTPMLQAQTTVTDGFDPNITGTGTATGTVHSVLVQPDGKILVAGNFSEAQPNGGAKVSTLKNIARFLPDGSLDSGFTGSTNGQITTMVLQTDGSILIGGKFTEAGGKPRNRVARFDSTGALDLTFDPNVGGSLTPEVTSLAVQADGKVLVGGGFLTVQPNGAATSTSRSRIARFNANGTLDTTFDPKANGMVLAIALQADGKILIGGGFTTLQPNGGTVTIRNHIARLLATGEVDAFDPNANDSVAAIAVQADGLIVIGGSFTSIQPPDQSSAITGASRLVRLLPDGTIDARTGADGAKLFLGTANGPVDVVKVQDDGRILVGGTFSNAGDGFRAYALRLLPNGTIDNDFVSGINFVVHSFAVQSNGAVIMGGGFTAIRGFGVTSIPRNHIARFSPGGVLEADFRPDVNGRLYTVATQSDGKILAAGSFTSVAGATHNGLVRLNADGTLDTAFSADVNGAVLALLQQSDGKILLGGRFNRVNGTVRPYLARLNTNGTLDETFNSPPNDQVLSLAQQADGKILIGGSFTAIQPNATTEPVARSRLARLTVDGSLDLTFNVQASDMVFTIVVQSDTKIVLGGNFTSLRNASNKADPGQSRFGIARISADGSIETAFNPNVNGSVRAIVRQGDGFVFGGSFSQMAPTGATVSTIRHNIARINADGSVDPNFDPNLNGTVATLLTASDGSIYVGGAFTTAQPAGTSGALARNYLVHLTSAGQADTTFDLGLDALPGNSLVAIAQNGAGNIVVAGAFSSVQPGSTGTPIPRSRLVQLTPAGGFVSSFNADVSSASGAAIEVLSQQIDGRIVVAGAFTGLSGTTGANIARFNPDSAPDLSFAPTMNGPIHAVAQQPTKGAQSTTQHAGMAWLESNGQLRSSFAPRSDLNAGLIRRFAAQGGKILVATIPSGDDETDLAKKPGALGRFNPDGTVDTTFKPAITGSVSALRIQSDGKILIGGTFTQVGGVTRNNLARLNDDGTLDTTFDPNPNGTVETIALQDGKIIIGGSFNLLGAVAGSTSTRNGIARINADGTLDATFNPSSNGSVVTILPLADGKIMIGGQFSALQPNGATTATNRAYVARLNNDGTVDSLDLKASGVVSTLVLQPDNKILVSGTFNAIAGETRNYLARLNSDGTLDAAFNPNPNGPVATIALQSDNKILIGGSFSALEPGNSGYNGNNAIPRSNAARLNADGTIDVGFNPNFDSTVNVFYVTTDGSILASGSFTVVQPTGSLLVGGSFTSVNNVAVANLALFSGDASISSTFLPNPNGAVYSITPTAAGSVIVGGSFTTIAGSTRNHLARFTANDVLDASFDPNVNGDVFTVLIQPDGKLLVGGSFTTIGGVSRSNLARLNSDGSVDSSFGPIISGAVHSLAQQSDGKILFTAQSSSDTSANTLGRLDASGNSDTSFSPANNKSVNSIAVQTDGKIVVGGSFTNIGGSTAQPYLARLNADGSLDASLASKPNGAVTALTLQADGKVLIGGMFSTVDGLPRFGVARVASKAITSDSFTAASDGSSVTWNRTGNGPEIYGAVFETSADYTKTWTTLGVAQRLSGTSNWRLSGLSLAGGANIFIRVRGLTPVSPNGSAGIVTAQTQLYLPSGTVTPTPTTSKPAINSATAINGAAGSSFRYAITATDRPTSYAASGLPTGLTLNAATGLITGTPTQSGSFTVTLTATNAAGVGAATTLNLFIAASPVPTTNVGRMTNLSVNAQVTASSPLIAGFVISGTDSKTILLRAIGPSLSSVGVTSPLAAPRLRLFNAAGQLMLERDAWGGGSELSSAFASLGAFPFASTSSADAAMLVTLAPGVYSLHVTTTSSTGGIAVAEVYDADANPPAVTASRLVNISTRTDVGGGRLVTAGFVIDGTTPKRVLIRGLGPLLAGLNVPNTLADPALTLFKSTTPTASVVIATNGDWQTQTTLDASYPVGTASEVVTATAAVGGGALASGSKDAAILVTLQPGVYSAQVSGQTSASAAGAAMVEVYEVP